MERLLGETVEGAHAEFQVLLLRVLDAVVTDAVQALHEHHHRGHARARDLGRVTYLTKQETKELLDLKQKWGYTDPRLEKSMENCDICANDVFRASWDATGVTRKAFDAPPPMGAEPGTATRAVAPAGLDQEALVKAVTEQVCKQLGIAAA